MSGTPVFAVPKPIVDFLEGLVSAFVVGASTSLFSADLATATPKLLVLGALTGGLNAVISAARRGLIQPTTPANP